MTNSTPMGKLFIVGFGPGNHEHLTFRAKEAIEASDVVIGYSTYIDLVKDLLDGKEVLPSGMQEEVGRAKAAVELAKQGKTVSVVSSGDAGIYGMAGLIYEVLYEEEGTPEKDLQVEGGARRDRCQRGGLAGRRAVSARLCRYQPQRPAHTPGHHLQAGGGRRCRRFRHCALQPQERPPHPADRGDAAAYLPASSAYYAGGHRQERLP